MPRECKQRPALVCINGIKLEVVAKRRCDQNIRKRGRDLRTRRFTLCHVPKTQLHLLHRLTVCAHKRFQIRDRRTCAPQECDHFLIGVIIPHTLKKCAVYPAGVIPIAVIHRVIAPGEVHQAQAGIQRKLSTQERLPRPRVGNLRAVDRNGIPQKRQRAPRCRDDHMPLLRRKRKRGKIPRRDDLLAVEQRSVEIQSNQFHAHLQK